jgi:hypothetical protein
VIGLGGDKFSPGRRTSSCISLSWPRLNAERADADPIAEDEPNLQADDGPESEGFALAPELTFPPTSRKLTLSEGGRDECESLILIAVTCSGRSPNVPFYPHRIARHWRMRMQLYACHASCSYTVCAIPLRCGSLGTATVLLAHQYVRGGTHGCLN